MFYPNLLNISKSDLVLEVGPGAYPHWRSDCLVDRFENASDVDLSQFGGAPQHTMGKPLFLIDEAKLPFRDGVFDYLICAQVLEHVPSQELPSLISEICRVSKRAYIEVPRPVFDLVYDFDVHLNLMDIVAGTIVCLPKEKTNLKKIKLLTQYALELRKSQGFSVERNSFNAVAVGMEFSGHIPLIICDTEEEFFQRISKNIVNIPPPPRTWIIKERLASFFYRHVHKQYAKSELSKLMINQD